jgi:hypothetical protein
MAPGRPVLTGRGQCARTKAAMGGTLATRRRTATRRAGFNDTITPGNPTGPTWMTERRPAHSHLTGLRCMPWDVPVSRVNGTSELMTQICGA